MDFKAAVQHENDMKPVTHDERKYYVIGHNELLKNVTIREISSNPMFTVPIDVDPAELS